MIDFTGPLGKFNYFGNGYFRLGFKPKPLTFITKQFENIGMIAGGTGIAPIYHLIQEAYLKDEKLNFSLLFTNRTNDDIILKDTLLFIAAKCAKAENSLEGINL